MAKKPALETVNLKLRYNGDDYLGELRRLQGELMVVQQARFRAGLRTVIVFEGWDAAGKGGAIKRLVHHLDPRMCRVWPIAAPLPHEKDNHYLYRFWRRLPEAGATAIFDRSWYGRVMVERVEGLAQPSEWKRAYREINEFERMLADDGITVMKFFLHVSEKEQAKRFVSRMDDPVKRWKLSTEDFRNRAKRADYEAAIEQMLKETSTRKAPWTLISSEQKKYARIAILKAVIQRLKRGVDLSSPPLSPEVEEMAQALKQELKDKKAAQG